MSTAAELEAWVRDELALDPAQQVAIREQPGNDPRCSPVVTEVAIGPSPAGGEAFSFHIERALAEVVPIDVVAALAFGGGH